MQLTFDSVDDLEQALRRAAAAHGEHGKEIGHEDADWPVGYARRMERERRDSNPRPPA